jgi:Na+/H+ antiporter NhaA
MIIPGLTYMALNSGTPGQHGPMVTDIAFSLGVLGMVKGCLLNQGSLS